MWRIVLSLSCICAIVFLFHCHAIGNELCWNLKTSPIDLTQRTMFYHSIIFRIWKIYSKTGFSALKVNFIHQLLNKKFIKTNSQVFTIIIDKQIVSLFLSIGAHHWCCQWRWFIAVCECLQFRCKNFSKHSPVYCCLFTLLSHCIKNVKIFTKI